MAPFPSECTAAQVACTARSHRHEPASRRSFPGREYARSGNNDARQPAVSHQQVAAKPNQKTGHLRSRSRGNRARSSRLAGLKKFSAGPPTRHDVCRLIGSSQRSSPALLDVRSAAIISAPSVWAMRDQTPASPANAPMSPAPIVSTRSPSASSPREPRAIHPGIRRKPARRRPAAHRTGNCPTVSAGNRVFAGRVNLKQQAHPPRQHRAKSSSKSRVRV